MIIKDWKKNLWSVPNLLSLFRLALIPVYVVIYLNATTAVDHYIAAGILAVSCLTDAIDGKIARHFNLISTVGKILDPLADKATQLTMIVCLAIRYPILLLVFGLFVIKEGFQLIAGFLTLRKGEMLTGALLSGKVCTAVLFVSLIALVLVPNMENWLLYTLTALDCTCMIISFLSYVRTYSTHSPMIQQLDSDTK